MKTNKTRSLLAGLPPRELLASFGLPPDALDQLMDSDQMASRARTDTWRRHPEEFRRNPTLYQEMAREGSARVFNKKSF